MFVVSRWRWLKSFGSGEGVKKLVDSSFMGVIFVREWAFDQNQIFYDFINSQFIRPYWKCVEIKELVVFFILWLIFALIKISIYNPV